MQIKYDLKWMILNCVVNRIPSWNIRKFLYKLVGLTIGAGSRIGIGTVVDSPRNIRIGKRSIINEYCHLDGRGGLTIGNDASISIYTKIISASHKLNSSTFEYYPDPVIIGDNVWIGTGGIILNGTILKKNSVVGAGCVFKGVADENGVYVGSPARKIKERRLEKPYHLTYAPFFR